MNIRLLVRISVLFNIILIGVVVSFFLGRKETKQRLSIAGPTKKVAVLLPVSHSSLEQIQKGFVESLTQRSEGDVSFKIYNANGNRTLMRSQLEDVLQKRFDLIFAIATPCAQMAKEVTIKKGLLVPIVYGAVTNPIKAGIIDSLASSGNHLTGIVDAVPHDRQLDLLKFLRPNIQRVLLVYDASLAGLEEGKQEIERILMRKNLTLQTVAVYHANEIMQKVPPFISQVDAVLVLKDSNVVAGIDALIKLCNRHGVTLMASDLDSVEKGAALGFGVSEYTMGVASAKKAELILFTGKKPSDIPSSMADNFKIKLNSATMKQQGLFLDKDLVFLMQFGEVFEG